MRRYEIEDALELLRRALSLEPDEEAEARLWRAVGKANALAFEGEAFWTAMESSLKVCSSKATCAETSSELASQTAIRSSMWATRPDRELVAGWIEQALELSEPESDSRARALIARSFWEQNTPEAAREASELAERSGDIELRSYAWGARSTIAFAEADFESALTWSQRRLGVKTRSAIPTTWPRSTSRQSRLIAPTVDSPKPGASPPSTTQLSNHCRITIVFTESPSSSRSKSSAAAGIGSSNSPSGPNWPSKRT
jgi:hypothetical protein